MHKLLYHVFVGKRKLEINARLAVFLLPAPIEEGKKTQGGFFQYALNFYTLIPFIKSKAVGSKRSPADTAYHDSFSLVRFWSQIFLS